MALLFGSVLIAWQRLDYCCSTGNESLTLWVLTACPFCRWRVKAQMKVQSMKNMEASAGASMFFML